MIDKNKIIKAWERCKICNMSPIATEEERKAYIECEYTTGLYCRRDHLIFDTIELLKKQPDIITCKDCKHYHQGFGCDLMQKPITKNEDYYCADGARI